MSMHEIESLVEYSVKTVATASPVSPLAKSICFSLYQIQDLFDCGYTLLRVRDELVQLGYLYLLPPELLPDPERSQAMKFKKRSGFFAKGTYFDHKTNRCCITAGSKLWKKLLSLGILPAEDPQEVRELSPFELIETIVPLASERFAQGDQTAVDTLGLWYGLFPIICIMTGYDEQPEAEKLENMLSLVAFPEAFKAAEEYVRDMDFEDFIDEEEMPFLEEWSAPYKLWKGLNDEDDYEDEDDETLCPEFYRNLVYECMSKNEFAEADRYASYMGDEKDPSCLLHRCMISLACHHWIKRQTPRPLPPESLLTIAETKAGLEYLIELPVPEQERTLCRMFVLQTLILSGDYPAAVEMHQQMYIEAIAALKKRRNGYAKQMQEIALSISYFQLLQDSLPDDYLPKKELIKSGLPGLMKLSAARELSCKLLDKRPQEAETLHDYLEQCDLLMPYIEE